MTNDSIGWMFSPAYSPDGEHVAVFWNRPGTAEVGLWIISLRDSSQTFLHPVASGTRGWTADGTLIYVWNRFSREFVVVPVSGGDPVLRFVPPFEALQCIPVSDDFALLCAEEESVSDAWMIENFDPEYAGDGNN